MMLLVPSDPMRPRRPDPHFADEAAAAREMGADVAVVDHDAVEGAGVVEAAHEAVRRVPPAADVVYRGWMLPTSRYALLEEALARGGTHLRTSAAQYRRAHELPGWYSALDLFTPETCWTTGSEWDAVARCLDGLGSGAAVLRDWTKSLKHHWEEAAFLPDVHDEVASQRVVERFLELRGDAFDGGFVLRRYEEFEGPEVRSWWVGGRSRLTTPHPDTPDDHPDVPPEVLADLEPAVATLGLPFVTVDLVRRSDGVWRVVELGDGQVSDRPSSCPAEQLVAVLLDGLHSAPGAPAPAER